MYATGSLIYHFLNSLTFHLHLKNSYFLSLHLI